MRPSCFLMITILKIGYVLLYPCEPFVSISFWGCTYTYSCDTFCSKSIARPLNTLIYNTDFFPSSLCMRHMFSYSIYYYISQLLSRNSTVSGWVTTLVMYLTPNTSVRRGRILLTSYLTIGVRYTTNYYYILSKVLITVLSTVSSFVNNLLRISAK